MLRNLIYYSTSIVLFFGGMIVYGIILNIREETLYEAMQEKGITELNNVQLIVSRNNYTLDLYSDTTLVKTYKAVFGQGYGKIKTSKDDNITPIGTYDICRIDTNNFFYKKIYINYPNKKDAAEAFKNGVINKNEFALLMIDGSKCPASKTRLGANIGIQGIGEYNFIFKNLPFAFNWTNGSIAVSNENIDEIISVLSDKTRVEIRN